MSADEQQLWLRDRETGKEGCILSGNREDVRLAYDRHVELEHDVWLVPENEAPSSENQRPQLTPEQAVDKLITKAIDEIQSMSAPDQAEYLAAIYRDHVWNVETLDYEVLESLIFESFGEEVEVRTKQIPAT